VKPASSSTETAPLVPRAELFEDCAESAPVERQAVLTLAGERVRYVTPDGAEYVAVCVPAFGLDTVNREE